MYVWLRGDQKGQISWEGDMRSVERGCDDHPVVIATFVPRDNCPDVIRVPLYANNLVESQHSRLRWGRAKAPYLSLQKNACTSPFYKSLENLPVSSIDGATSFGRKRAGSSQSVYAIDILSSRD